MTNTEQWEALLTRLTTEGQIYTVTVLTALREAVPGLRVPEYDTSLQAATWGKGKLGDVIMWCFNKLRYYCGKYPSPSFTLDAIPTELITALGRFCE